MCPADEGCLQGVEAGLLCLCAVISVCALSLLPMGLTSSVHQQMPLSVPAWLVMLV